MKQHQKPTILYPCTKKKEGMVGERDLSLKSSPHLYNYKNAAIRVYINIDLNQLSREMGHHRDSSAAKRAYSQA